MAVDTRDKRFSMLGFGQPHGLPYVLPHPDGTVDAADRPQLLRLYHGSGISIVGGHPVRTRWGGVPYVRQGVNFAGRSW